VTDEQVLEVCKKYTDSASFAELFECLIGSPDIEVIIDNLPVDWLRERMEATKDEEWELWLEIE
jgi:hypothetical protein